MNKGVKETYFLYTDTSGHRFAFPSPDFNEQGITDPDELETDRTWVKDEFGSDVRETNNREEAVKWIDSCPRCVGK